MYPATGEQVQRSDLRPPMQGKSRKKATKKDSECTGRYEQVELPVPAKKSLCFASSSYLLRIYNLNEYLKKSLSSHSCEVLDLSAT